MANIDIHGYDFGVLSVITDPVLAAVATQIATQGGLTPVAPTLYRAIRFDRETPLYPGATLRDASGKWYMVVSIERESPYRADVQTPHGPVCKWHMPYAIIEISG